MAADLVFRGGTVLTLESAPARAEALAVRDGKVLALGTNADAASWIGAGTRVVELEGKALLPGFIDAHTHLLRSGLERTRYLALDDCRSREELFERVAAAVREREGGRWVLGRGWDESAWAQARYPTRAELDAISGRHPIALIRVCGHIVCVNSAALRANPPPRDPSAVAAGQGWLREEAAWSFLAALEPELEERLAGLEAGIARAHALGITCVHDVVDRPALEAYARLKRRGGLALRVRLHLRHDLLEPLRALGLSGEFGDASLRIGALKLFADGSLGARNAALEEPYADDPDHSGQLNHAPQALADWVRRGREAGLQLAVHAIGDRAIGAVLDAFEAGGVAPGERARIEHLELPTAAHLERMARLGVIASMQPNFLRWSGPGKLYERRLGPEREAAIDPHRRVLDAGVRLAFGSDGMPLGPLYGLHLAVHAPHPSQRLSLEEALRAYTLGGAYAGFAEEELGSLTPGKQADLIVLDNPFTAQERLQDLEVEQVYLAGERVL